MMKILFFLLGLQLVAAVCVAQIFQVDSLPADGIVLNKGWKWQAGDNPAFAKNDFNDSAWQEIDPTKDIMDLPQIHDGQIGWIRLKIKMDSSLMPLPLMLNISQRIASEIYINGVLIKKYGELTPTTKGTAVLWEFVPLPKDKPEVLIAVRYGFQNGLLYHRFATIYNPFFRAELSSVNNIPEMVQGTKGFLTFHFIKFGAFIILFALHLFIFILSPHQKANLLISGMAFCYASHSLIFGVVLYSMPVDSMALLMYSGVFRVFLFSLAYLFLIRALYEIFNFRVDLLFRIVIVLTITLLISFFLSYKNGVLISEIGTGLFFSLTSIYLILKAFKAQKRDSGIMLIGLCISIVCLTFRYLNFVGFNTYALVGATLVDSIDLIGVLSIPISISYYLGSDFAFINKTLTDKLKEVQELSAEKQNILADQKERLEQQVEQRTAELKASQAQLIQKEKLASLGEFTSGIAHEIQNPLNFVNNFSEVSAEMVGEMQEELDKGDIEEAKSIAGDLHQNLQKITHHGQRASSIVKGMLEHSRATTGERQLTDLNKIADEYLRLAYHGFKAKNQNFESDRRTAEYELRTDENLPLINVVPQEIGRVLLNLINNAFYAVHERAKLEALYQPKVVVSTKAIDNQVIILVQDNGVGIPAAIKDKIFQPFFTTKPTGEGTGLGLSLSYDIVTKGHGGTLEVGTKEGEGSTFTVTLPL